MVHYYINNNNLKDFGVYVKESEGVLDLPKPKELKKFSFAEYNGSIVDLRNVRFEEQVITLKCFVAAESPSDLVQKVKSFSALCSGSLKRLQIDVTDEVSLFYDIYLSSGISIKKKWSDGKIVGEFDLQLTEPEPIKKVLRFSATADNLSLSLSLSSESALFVTYGDGEDKKDVYGTNINLGHEYGSEGVYYIIIHGNVSEIGDLTTTAEVIWQ